MANSARLRLPFLIPGQGQKDITHNEALMMLDMLVQPVAQSVEIDIPPATRQDGGCWIVPAGAQGDWAGQDGAVAYWSDGGWRFAQPAEGWQIWVVDEQAFFCYTGGIWKRLLTVTDKGEAIAGPAGGSTVDVQARASIAAIIHRLEGLGILFAEP